MTSAWHRQKTSPRKLRVVVHGLFPEGVLYGLGEAFLSCLFPWLLVFSRLAGRPVERTRSVAFTALPACRPAGEGEGGAGGEGHRLGARAREERAEEARIEKGAVGEGPWGGAA